MNRYTAEPSYKGVKLSTEYKKLINDFPNWLPTHYIVSVASAIKRRETIEKKLIKLGVNYNLVDAYTPSDDIIINHYGRGRNLNGKWGCGSPMGGVVACMASHFKALKTFLASTDEIAVILEDDVLFRRDYKERLRNIIDKYIGGDNFPTLITFVGNSHPKDELSNDVPTVWATWGYLITRKYAEDFLLKYDRPHVELDRIIRTDKIPTLIDKYGASSEIIVMKSGGLACNVSLLYEDKDNHHSLIGNVQLNGVNFDISQYITDY